jgi:hypothetical protein
VSQECEYTEGRLTGGILRAPKGSKASLAPPDLADDPKGSPANGSLSNPEEDAENPCPAKGSSVREHNQNSCNKS